MNDQPAAEISEKLNVFVHKGETRAEALRRELKAYPDHRSEMPELFLDLWVRGTPGARYAAQWLVDCANLLLEKNLAYGDSALNPIRIFSKAEADEQIRVRLDDKLSRMMRGAADARANIPEDTVRDLVNYLALLQAAERFADVRNSPEPEVPAEVLPEQR